jgi:hypothetical protein
VEAMHCPLSGRFGDDTRPGFPGVDLFRNLLPSLRSSPLGTACHREKLGGEELDALGLVFGA